MKKIKLCIHDKPFDEKPQGVTIGQITKTLQPAKLSIEKIIKLIGRGHSFTASTFVSTAEGYAIRTQQAFLSTQLIGLDYDDIDGRPVELQSAVNELEVVGLTYAFGYQTFSSTKEHMKFRLMIVLDEPIENAQEAKNVMQYLKAKITLADAACFDHARLFFGAKNGTVWTGPAGIDKTCSTSKLLQEAQNALQQPGRVPSANTKASSWDAVTGDSGQPYEPFIITENRNDELLRFVRAMANRYDLHTEEHITLFKRHAFDIANMILPDRTDFPDSEFYSVIEQAIKYALEETDKKPSFKRMFSSNESSERKTIFDEARELADHFIKIDAETLVPFNGQFYDVDQTRRDPHAALYKLTELCPGKSLKQIKDLEEAMLVTLGVSEDPPEHLICFRNGLLDLDTKKLLPFDRDVPVTSQVPFNYNPKAIEPDETFSDWVRSVFGDIRGTRTLAQMTAEMIYNDVQFKQMILNVGEGGTGKSQLIHLLRSITNEATAMKVQRLESRFDLNDYKGSRLLFEDDSPPKFTASGSLKSVITGEYVRTEGKYQSGTTTRITGLLIANFNEIPQIKDESGSHIADRFMILDWDNMKKFRQSEGEVKDFYKLLATEQNIEWLLMQAIEELIDARENDVTAFYETNKIANSKAQWLDNTKSPFDIITNDFELAEKVVTTKALVFDRYVDEMRRSFPGEEIMNEDTFWRAIAKKFGKKNLIQKRPMKNGVRQFHINIVLPDIGERYRLPD